MPIALRERAIHLKTSLQQKRPSPATQRRALLIMVRFSMIRRPLSRQRKSLRKGILRRGALRASSNAAGKIAQILLLSGKARLCSIDCTFPSIEPSTQNLPFRPGGCVTATIKKLAARRKTGVFPSRRQTRKTSRPGRIHRYMIRHLSGQPQAT